VLGTNTSTNTSEDAVIDVRGDNITLDHLEITTATPYTSQQGVILGGSGYYASNLKLLNSIIHHNGASGQYEHGIYCDELHGGLIQGNWIYSNAAYGIQFYPDCDNVDFLNNVVDDNGDCAQSALGSSPCTLVTNNGRGIAYGGEGSQHSDNVNVGNSVLTTFGGAGRSLVHCYLPGTNDSLNNSLLYQASGADDDCGSSITRSGVVRGDPLYVNRGAHDYRLQPGSPARSLMGAYADLIPGPRY
jgi:hypothetical protein